MPFTSSLTFMLFFRSFDLGVSMYVCLITTSFPWLIFSLPHIIIRIEFHTKAEKLYKTKQLLTTLHSYSFTCDGDAAASDFSSSYSSSASFRFCFVLFGVKRSIHTSLMKVKKSQTRDSIRIRIHNCTYSGCVANLVFTHHTWLCILSKDTKRHNHHPLEQFARKFKQITGNWTYRKLWNLNLIHLHYVHYSFDEPQYSQKWFFAQINWIIFRLQFHFSFDVRGRQFGQAKLWSSPTVFGSRAFFSTANSPAQLKVDNIQLADEGMYRCRVDFRNSPTRNLKINLTVIGKCWLLCSIFIRIFVVVYYSWMVRAIFP